MIIFKKSSDLETTLLPVRKKSQHLGFVPTMGALHDGHISLLKKSKSETDVTVCSIFVNPAQFNDLNDFKKYPSTLDEDIQKLETSGCDVLFLPHVEEIYPDGFQKDHVYDLGYLETVLEGAFRPGHFQGVCMAVDRLLRIVEPSTLYLGQKDYQQCLIIERLIHLMGLEKNIRLRICPILREKNGLAMSSRNMRLNPDQRTLAAEIYKSLLFLKNNFGKDSPEGLKKEAAQLLQVKGFRTDYVEIADTDTLHPVTDWNANKPMLGLAAAYIDGVRLIDNILLN